jgi:benzodiazapine receptor
MEAQQDTTSGAAGAHKRPDWVMLLVLVALSFLAGVVGSAAGGGTGGGEWYQGLSKPSFTPPAWVFAWVWSVLYLMMGVSAWLAWRRPGAGPGMALFGVQLVLNAGWSVVFFGFHSIGLAFVEIVILWGAVAATTVAFFRQAGWAGAMMLPYLGWISFAAVLNFAFWQYN